MSSTSERASGYDRDPRSAGTSAAYDPYPASSYTGRLTALAGVIAVDIFIIWALIAARQRRDT